MRKHALLDALSLASRQRGLLTHSQALRCAMSRHDVAQELASGRWQEVQPNVYAVTGAPGTWRRELLAATLVAAEEYERHPEAERPRIVASHSTAAVLLGIERAADDSKVEVTAAGTSLPVRRGVTVHRTRRLDPCDVTTVDGIPCLTGARFLVDQAALVGQVDLTALVDDVHCARLSGRSWTFRRARALRNGRKGVGLVLKLTGPGARAEFKSWLERYVHGRLARTGLPPALWNHELRVNGRLLGIVDTFWPQGRTLSVEWDGLRFHSTAAQLRGDKARDRALTIAGHPPLRYTWLDVMERWDDIVTEIRQALHHRGVST